MPSEFPTGVVIFFRIMNKDDTLARSVHLNGRYIESTALNEADYVIRGPNDEMLGIYPRDFVAAILPLNTTGPGAQQDANNPSFKPQH